MKRMSYFLLAGIFLLPLSGKPQEKYSLNRLLKVAIENSHTMKKAALQQSESSSKVKETKAIGFPQLEGALSYSRMGVSQYFSDLDLSEDVVSTLPESVLALLSSLSEIDAIHTTSADLTVSQLLYSQPYLTGVKQARKAEELYQVLLQKTEEEVIDNVASMYYQILASYSALEILDKNIQALNKLYRILKLQYENDFVKQTDVNRLKVSITNLQTQHQSLKNTIETQERILKIISGLPIEEAIILDQRENNYNENASPAVGLFSIETLPDYQLLQKQIELAELQIKASQASYYPNLLAFGQLSYSNYATDFSFNDFSDLNTIGLSATIPIFSSGMRKQQVFQSQLQLQQTQQDFELNTKYLETNYKNASNTLLSAWANLQAQQENKELASEVYDQVKLQFDEGMASLTDLLNVETALLEAENLFNQQLLKYKLAEIALLKSTGQLKSLINN